MTESGSRQDIVAAPKCGKHPALQLTWTGDGWYCPGCKAVAITPETWPGSDERFSAGLDLDRLPSFLALKFAQCDGEKHAVVRLWQVCDAIEVLLRLCVALGAADMAAPHGGSLPDDVARILLEGDRIQRPTLDGWLRMAKAVAPGAGVGAMVPELGDAIGVVEDILSNEPWAVMKLRNDLAHGPLPEQAAAASTVGQYVRRIRCAISKMPWLVEVEFVAGSGDGEVILRGPLLPAGPVPSGGVEVVARRGAKRHSVWPICAWEEGEAGPRPAPAVYVRAGDKRLEHAMLRGAVGFVKLKGPPWLRFSELFRIGERMRLLGMLDDFEAEVRQEAARVVGRKDEIDRLLDLARTVARPAVVWIPGRAGAGKSALMAKAFDRLSGSGQRVLVWRFNRTDPRCTVAHFLRYLVAEVGRVESRKLGDDPRILERKLHEVLEGEASRRPTTILVDGLDEIERVDPGLPQLFGRIAMPGLLWICSGRPTPALIQAAADGQWLAAFACDDGLPRLTDADVAEWIRDTVPGSQRDELVRGEESWLEDVVRASDGLPQYVRLLLDDLCAGSVRVGHKLPQGLGEYWERLLAENVISDSARISPSLLVAVAILRQAPTMVVLEELLALSGSLSLPDGERRRELLASALDRLRNFVRIETDEDGEDRVFLSHDSLTDHIATSKSLEDTRSSMCAAIHGACRAPARCGPEQAQKYFYRVGISQLIEDGAAEAAKEALVDVGYLYRRLQSLKGDRDWLDATAAIVEDLARAGECVRVPLLESLNRLSRRHHHQIVRGGPKMLFQLLMSYRDVWRDRARAWARESNFDEDWLDVLAEVGEVGPGAEVGAPLTIDLAGWEDPIALVFHPDVPMLAAVFARRDAELWDAVSGRRIGTIAGCHGQAAHFGTDGRLAVFEGMRASHWHVSLDGTVAPEGTHELPVQFERVIPGLDGEATVVCWEDEALRAFDASSLAPVQVPSRAIVLLSDSIGTMGNRPWRIPGILDRSQNRWWSLLQSGHVVELPLTGQAADQVAGALGGLPVEAREAAGAVFREVGATQIGRFGSWPELGVAAAAAARMPVVAFCCSSGVVALVMQEGRLVPLTDFPSDRWHPTLAISGDGALIAMAKDKAVRVWRLDLAGAGGVSAAESAEVDPAFRVVLSPDTSSVFCCRVSGSVHVYDFESGDIVRSSSLWSGWSELHDFLVSASPSGSRVAVRNRFQEISIVDAFTLESLRIEDLDDGSGDFSDYAEIGFTADSSRVWAETTNGGVREWDAATGREVRGTTDSNGRRVAVGERLIRRESEERTEPDQDAGNALVVQELEVTKVDEAGELTEGRRIWRASWIHEHGLCASDATLDGRVVIGDDRGRLLFLRRRSGVPFEPRVVR